MTVGLFCNLNVYPTVNELALNKRQPFSSNMVKGSYETVDHYLSVHLPLLREDFVNPLREDVQRIKDMYIKKVKLENMTLYPGTIFETAAISQSHHVGFLVKFQSTDCSRIDWRNSKQFMVGSLLLFTDNDFSTFFLATVLQPNEEQLKRGRVLIRLVKNDVATVNKCLGGNQRYLMAESSTFFAPYYHVIEKLKTLNESNFPMVEYIVYGKYYQRRPSYMNGRQLQNDISVDDRLKPTCKMNSSQYMAFRTALTSTFSLIQGPPGTGKTFVGLQIIKVLLKILPSSKKPILVICQTNHALDQFLEGIAKVTSKIIRAGSRSSSDVIKQFNLRGDNNRDTRKQLGAKVGIPKMIADIRATWKVKQTSAVNENCVNLSAVEMNEFIYKSNELNKLQQTVDACIMKTADVVGLTTSCAAKMQLEWKHIKSAVVIVEEAAEILEAHVVAALPQSCEQVIMIGDQKQLRPNVATHKLGTEYDLNVSLFERLIENGMDYTMLNIQQRMRPQISRLIAPIYPELKDGKSVQKYESIKGICKDVFFLEHNECEEKLCCYLLYQGYKSSQIVILTFYAAQVDLFVNKLLAHRSMAKVKCVTVDNYQGEESDIILLSLVRSNPNEKASIGFVAIENRVCVALSRAKKGLFIVGNMDNVSSRSPLWRKIKEALQEQRLIGREMVLCCERHKTRTKVSKPEDFVKVRRGGCTNVCGARSTNGGVCEVMCHGVAVSHRFSRRTLEIVSRERSVSDWPSYITEQFSYTFPERRPGVLRRIVSGIRTVYRYFISLFWG